MAFAKTDLNLLLLLLLNIVLFAMHIIVNYQNIYYFFQLTIIGQIVIIANFCLSILLHEKKSGSRVRLFLSRLHLVGLSLETVVVLGYWALRIFFTKGIYKQGEQLSLLVQILSVWVHGGNYITMFYFVKTDQIVMETSKRVKYLIHLIWGVPFLFLQYLKFILSGQHVYEFIRLLTWVQIIVFYLALYLAAVGIDYVLTMRHGLKLTIRHMSSNLQDLQKQKQNKQKQQYEKEEAGQSKAQKIL